MTKAIVILILISMICVSISGAAFSINDSIEKNINSVNEKLVINQPTESAEVNTRVLQNINQEVDKYLNFGDYISNDPPRKTPKQVEFPWSNRPLPIGDFVEWIIHVNYKNKHFEEEIDISVIDFKDRFLKHPLHYEQIDFDVDENGEDDLQVFYSFYTGTLLNNQENIQEKSLETCLKAKTGDIPDRTAKLEIWSEIRLNYGLIKELSRDMERSLPFNGKFKSIFGQFIEKLEGKFENTGFTRIKNLLNLFSGRLQKNPVEEKPEPDIEVFVNDDDYISAGIGVSSPEGENIPLNFEKRFAVAKRNIFKPMIFEQELKQVQSREPLGLLFGFQAYTAGSQTPSLDLSFEIDFDPAIYICTQFIPRSGYVYYGFDSDSAHSQETRVTFYLNYIKGGYDEGLDVELSLIFDSTTLLANSNNWISFDVTINPIGFEYRANKKHTIGVLLTSPGFSAKLKLGGIPDYIKCYFDADLSFTYQQGQLLDASATGSLNVDMSSNMDDITLYYPELSSDEPKIELIKVSNLPAKQKLEAHSHLRIQNGSMTSIMGEGYIKLDMSDNLGSTKVFYRKADPNDPDKLFISVPQVPGYNQVGAKAELYIDLDDFSNTNNYVYGRAYRTSSGNLAEISGYLPGETEPIVSITDIPAHSEAKGKLEWNKLKGYAYARRQSAGGPDPITINVDIGTFNIYNYLQILDGHIDCNFYLNQDGYFGFDTANDMIGDTLIVTDTSTGNQLGIEVYKVSANNLWVDWDLDMNEEPIQIEELAVSGKLSLLEDFEISATYQGKNLQFEGNWKVGKEGIFSVDFSQDEPIELILDDLFPDDPTWDLGGGVIISDDFHFDIKWNWEQGVNYNDPGYFLVNEDTNDPNFDWIGISFTYDPSGSNNPQYGIEMGGNNVGLIVYLKWWKHPQLWLPEVWWYVYIQGDFYLDLLWEGDWFEDVHIPIP